MCKKGATCAAQKAGAAGTEPIKDTADATVGTFGINTYVAVVLAGDDGANVAAEKPSKKPTRGALTLPMWRGEEQDPKMLEPPL